MRLLTLSNSGASHVAPGSRPTICKPAGCVASCIHRGGGSATTLHTAKRCRTNLQAVNAQNLPNPAPKDAVMAYLQGVEVLAITTAAATQACLLIANAKMPATPAVQPEPTQAVASAQTFLQQPPWLESMIQKEPLSSIQGFAVVIAIMCNICIRWFSR